MKKLILLLAGSLVFAAPAMAHRRYPNHPNYGKPHHHPRYIPKHNHCHYHNRDGLWHCHRHSHGGPGYGHHGEKYLHKDWNIPPRPLIEFHF